ncbi:MAG: TatD family hydrolase [Candidatus Omnitrophota bacterium]
MTDLIDAHCHLQDERVRPELDNIMKRAKDSGVVKMVLCGTCEKDWPEILNVKEKYPDMAILSFGLHPWYVKDRPSSWFEKLEKFIREYPAGVGEIGLDFAIQNVDVEEQKEVFLKQLELALKYKRPVSIHCRKAHEALIDILENKGPFENGGIIHSYSGSAELIKRFCGLGFSISFSCSITRSGNKKGRNTLKSVPLENLVLETDSPDILPAGWAGLNEPANLILVVKTAAGLLNLSEEEIARITSNNTKKIFGNL